MEETERLKRDLKLLKSAVEINTMMFTPDFMDRDPVLYSRLFKDHERIVQKIREIETKLTKEDL